VRNFPRFSTLYALRALWFENIAENQKSKTIVCSTDAWALVCRRRHTSSSPQLWETFSLKLPVKCDKNGYTALTQPHVNRLRSDFTRWYFVAPGKMRNCQKTLGVESNMADDAQIFNTRNPISFWRQKLETSNLVCAPTTMSFVGMQNTRSRGTLPWPIFKFAEPCEYLSNG